MLKPDITTSITNICIQALLDKKNCKHRYKHTCTHVGAFNLAVQILRKMGWDTQKISILLK